MYSVLNFPYAVFSDSPFIILQSVIDGQKGAVAGRHAEGAPGVEMVGERHTVATRRHDSPDLKGTVDVTVATKAYTVLTVLPYISMLVRAKCCI